MPIEQRSEQIDEHTGSEKTASIRKEAFGFRIIRGLGRLLLAHADFVVMLVALGLVTRYCLLLPHPVVMGTIDFSDTSAAVDMLAKAQQGIWSGRDVFFTYGPLFQKLLSWGPLHQGMSLGSFYIYLWLFHYWTIFIFIYILGSFLLRSQPPWIRVFYLLLLTIFWLPINWILFEIKSLFPLACFAVFLRTFPQPGARFSSLCWRAAIVATSIITGILISGDAGTYTAIAFLVVTCAYLLAEQSGASLTTTVKYAALTAVFFAVYVLAVNKSIGNLLDFRFWKQTYEIVAQYRWSHAVRMIPEMIPVFWLSLTLNLAIFAWYGLMRMRASETSPRDRAAWLAMLGFGMVTLQTMIVSAEHFHAALSLFPWIALSAALLLGATEIKVPPLRLTIALVVMLLTTGFFSGPHALFVSRPFFQGHQASDGIRCPDGLYELDDACLEPNDFSKLKPVRDLLMQHSAASDFIGVFPYENIYGFVSRRRVAGALWQTYVVAGDYMTQRELESFEKARPSWIVYSVEPWQTYAVGGIPNFTRTPSVWLYWQRWYRHELDAQAGLMLLKRDEERGSHWNLTSTSVLLGPVQSTQTNQKIALPVRPLGDDWDFIKISLRAHYPLWWKFLKPSIFVVWLHFDQGPDTSIPAIVQPDHPYEIWVYPWDQPDLANYFSSDARQWRREGRRHLQSLSVQSLPIDWISVRPSQVTIADVQTVKLSEK